MSRKPIHLETAGHSSDRQAIWEAIRRVGKDSYFGIPDVRGALHGPTPLGKIREYMKCLEAGGYVACIYNDAPPHVYQLLRDIGVDAPRLRRDGTEVTQGLGREQLWRAIKILGQFDAHDLVQFSDTVKLSEAREYARYLHKASYLVRIQKANTRGGLARYRLIPGRYTGPKPPMIQRTKQVFDPNLGKVVWPVGDDNE